MAIAAGLAVAAAGLAACSSSGGTNGAASSSVVPSASAAAGATVSSRGVRASGSYIPQPASPDVAAAYLTLTNTTAAPVRLTAVGTDVARTVMPMTETDHGGVGAMTTLHGVVVPAHGDVRFVPDHAHLMLEHPSTLHTGDHVRMTLRFSNDAALTLAVPVVPIGVVPADPPSSYASSAS